MMSAFSKASRLDHAFCDFHRVKEAGASGRNVEGNGLGGSQLLLDVAGGRGGEGVGSDRGDNNEVEVFRCHAGLLKGLLGCL